VQFSLYKCISIPAKVRILNADFGAASLKGFQLQGALPLTADQGLCPWTPLGAPPPDPRYRLALAMGSSHPELLTPGYVPCCRIGF